jgi:hypothetical protein
MGFAAIQERADVTLPVAQPRAAWSLWPGAVRAKAVPPLWQYFSR